jgi:hypothetical protein
VRSLQDLRAAHATGVAPRVAALRGRLPGDLRAGMG